MASFEQLYEKHLKPVFRYALSCVGRRDIAEEITSDAFLALYRNWNGIDQERLPAWLFTVVKNRARDYWKHQQIEARYAEGLQAPSADPPSSRLETALLDSPCLKPTHRVCLLLRYAYGMKLGEIAQQTGLSATQVKGLLQYGRELLRKEYVRTAK